MKRKVTYKDAGVDIEKANSLVRSIGALSKKTLRPEVLNRADHAGISFGWLILLCHERAKKPLQYKSKAR